MESTKKNTLVFEFPKEAPGPSLIEMSRFVKCFRAERENMDTCYRNADEKCIYIRFKTVESFNNAVMDNPDAHTFRYSDGRTVQVKMSVAAGSYKYVRIFNLPPEIEDDEIGRVLVKYGKIKKLIREKFPPECELDLYTGIRGAYMDVQKPIPAALFIGSAKTRIFYEGLKNRCFHCKADDHMKYNCPVLAKLRHDGDSGSGSSKQNPITYASALSSPKSILAARLDAMRSLSEETVPKVASVKDKIAEVVASNVSCNEENEESRDALDVDSSDDNSIDFKMEDKGMRTKRALIGVTSQSESEGSNAGSSVQRSVPKKQKNQEPQEVHSIEGSPLEAIQNILKEQSKEEDTEQELDRKTAQPRRNSKKRGKR